ncbi:MAG: VCBS repeat-containing protein [Acidobacteriota bacterium]
MKKLQKMWCLATLVATSTFFFAGFHNVSVSANNSPQTLPFSQNWTTNAITTNDDWSPVPGIVGFLGDYTAASPTAVDPRTLLDPFASVAVDVIANQTNPDTLANGGVAEFDALTNPSVALNGSGTADAPFIVLYLNTTGQSNIRIRYNARDLDASVDNSVQPVNTQFRAGSTGDFSNVAGGYIADATTTGTATQVTAVDVTLPAAANNQPVVQVRIMTTNAIGNDEWVGIDDIQATNDGTAVINRANADFNGDGKTDYVITRDTLTPLAEKTSAGSPEGGLLQKYWYINTNGSDATSVVAWGLQNDNVIPEDFDGDGKDDIAVWRSGLATEARFYILQSGTGTVRVESFGAIDDQPGVVGDYDGDGKADPATFRCPTTTPGQCFFFYRGSLNNPGGNITYGPWGFGTTSTILPNPGDFDGDGKFDFCIRRDGGSGAGQFILRRSTDGGVEYINWGLTTDAIIPGDWDGDLKSDFAVVRFVGNQAHWYILERDGGGTGAQPIIFGDPTQDSGAWGDYDGDGRQDIAVWRPNADPTMNYFFVRLSSSGAFLVKEWGRMGDQPVAEWNGFGGPNVALQR